jgi:phage shock protein PspC (stress-responsive transcriptional regulator)
MKKTFSISLAQTLFVIEEDAYIVLDEYLRTIRAHFAHTEGHDEIMADIESRISEQLQENKKSIVTLPDVHTIITSMGTVEDFGDTEQAASATGVSTKKFYRNPEDKIIAGVCSGLGAYTGIDTLWIRIIFVILTLTSGGFGIFVYLILALVVPEAKTASQKLEMHGSPVTLETMSAGIQEKVTHARLQHESKIKEILSLPFDALKAIFQFISSSILPLARIVFGIAVAIGSLFVLLALSVIAPLILMNADIHFGFPITSIVSEPLLYTSITSIYATAIIPLLVLFMCGIGLARKQRVMNTTLSFVLLFLWCVAVVTGGITTVNAIQRVDTYAQTNNLYQTTTREIPITSPITSIVANDGIRVTYLQGEVSGIVLTGNTQSINRVAIDQHEETVTLRMNNSSSSFCFFCNHRIAEATITAPNITALEAASGSRVTARSWKSAEPVTLTIAEGSRADITVTAPSVQTIANEGSRADLRIQASSITFIATEGSRILAAGTSDSLTATAQEGAHIESTVTVTDMTEATALHGSQILLGGSALLTATAQYGSHIEYTGNPVVNETSDVGSSIQPVL